MSGFKFERNLPHQTRAVKSVLGVFNKARVVPQDDIAMSSISNPIISIEMLDYFDNITKVQENNGHIDKRYKDTNSNIIDISMETGTGKTYTYTKMAFELYKELGISKFIIIVPTLSIKAGTVNFLKSSATKEHFRQEYGCEIKSYIVQSKKNRKGKKTYMPQAIKEFVEANSLGANYIHMLVINAGMINSDSMGKAYDVNLFDRFNIPFEAIASIKPFTIIDEPHKFATINKTWQNIEKFQSQYIFRYGATFNNEFRNLVYRLSAIDAFNHNLVKGVITYVEDFSEGKNISVTLKNTDGVEATFELNSGGKKSLYRLIKKESLSKIHNQMQGLQIENLNKTKVLLSNGLELKRNSVINPYSYSQTLQDKMMSQAIAKHFEIERELLTQEVRIKPLTLFFIDDIEGYRDGNTICGSLKNRFEEMVRVHIERLLKEESDSFYLSYLEKSLKDISLTHGGYFSKDNTQKDDKIEKEINEILHDKESLLSLGNIRRFIFSKWTLKEGWDNPNIFQICKLRSSGSTTSKLQEVGRGLRLPVNEYMSRVKDKQFDLHYYVDFTEKDFVQSLITEINDKSQGENQSQISTKLTNEMIEKITNRYRIDEEYLLEQLDSLGVIKRNNDFKENGFEIIKNLYPDAFEETLNRDKIRSANDKRAKATLRRGKYQELKELWERINQKVRLEYKIDSEEDFYKLLKGYFLESRDRFKTQGVTTKRGIIDFEDNKAIYREIESVTDEILPISIMRYREFLIKLATSLSVNIRTLHRVFIDIQDILDINLYRNMQTISAIRVGFNKYLLDNAIDKFSISYNKITNEIHPTKLTTRDGEAKEEINSSDIGVHFDNEKEVATSYLFNELFYDSNLEKENITKNIDEVTVFTKIPKNSIQIPVAGGGTYSPDFAYVIKSKDGSKTLNLIVETKDKSERDLYIEESAKIRHAQRLFSSLDSDIKVEFRTQFRGDIMVGIIRGILEE